MIIPWFRALVGPMAEGLDDKFEKSTNTERLNSIRGDVLIKNICATDVDIIASGEVK